MTTASGVVAKEILRYELEAVREDFRDPIRPSYWRTSRSLFSRQCARAWREFAIAIEALETPPVGKLWPCKRHHIIGCAPCFAVWLRFHPGGAARS